MLLILLLLLFPTLAIADEPVVTYTGDPAPKVLDEWNAFVAGRPSFLQPGGVAASRDGLLYVLDWEHGNVLRFKLDGTYVDAWKVPGPFHRPAARSLNAIAVSDRMVYVSDLAAECIHQFTPDGRHKGTIPFRADLNGLAVDPLGNLYVSGSHILGVDTLIAPQPAGSKSPPDTIINATTIDGPALWKLNRMGNVLNQWNQRVGAVTVDAQGMLLAVTEVYLQGPVSILRLDPTGGRISEHEVKELGRGAYRSINDIAVDQRGHVFMTSAQLRKIIELDEAGNWTRAWSGAGPDHRPLLQPVGTAVDTSGCLYVTDWAVSRVVKYDPRKAP
ncbi:MAG TPA: NHL repeat-containing protein [Dongiaceae bacterium]|jgi:sugar lactone lactonase YvrE|nr:NHL repeat-containing protein [Dongiaceae bacterium]